MHVHAGDGMLEGLLVGVKHKAGITRGASAAIELVAQKGEAGIAQVHANLVFTASEQIDGEQRSGGTMAVGGCIGE